MERTVRWVSKFEVKPGSWVYVPNEAAIQHGNAIKDDLEEKWTVPAYFYHLRSGGHVEAIRRHRKNSFFLHLDIQNFFGCVNKTKIIRSLKKYYAFEKSHEIAVFSTVRNSSTVEPKYVLPFGFVQSPIIASICLHNSRLGKCLSKLSEDNNFLVSVYMDDIIISSLTLGPLQIIKEKIIEIAEKSNFKINPNKIEGPSAQISAFNIALSHDRLKISDLRLREFYKQYKYAGTDHQREGILGYIYSVDDEQGKELKRSLSNIILTRVE